MEVLFLFSRKSIMENISQVLNILMKVLFDFLKIYLFETYVYLINKAKHHARINFFRLWMILYTFFFSCI
jgi:hypothetical protein